jgi:tetratricopeptide (TPR) repeat protein
MELELQAAIGPTYMATVGWAAPEVEHSSARLRDLASASGDGPRLFQAMWGLWTVHFLRGQLDPALDMARQVLGMAAQTNNPMLRVAGHHAVGYTHFYRGEYVEAIRHADDGLALFDLEREKQIVAIFQFSSSCALWYFRAHSQHMLGDAEKASESLHSSQMLAEQLRHAPSRAYLLCELCYFFRMLDDVERVSALAPAMRSLSTAEGFSLWVPIADLFLAWASARQGGDPIAAAERIEDSIAVVHHGLTYLNELDFAGMHAATLLLAGQPAKAFRVTRDALELARVGKQRHGEPELLRLQGDAASAMGNREEAAALYRQGIESALSMGARFLERRSASALAGLVAGGK